jgi:hypothetical protein
MSARLLRLAPGSRFVLEAESAEARGKKIFLQLAGEIADLIACPAAQCERWIKPLGVYDFRSVKE